MAEREGFEPSIRFWRILTFQASAFDHSATAPHALEGMPPIVPPAFAQACSSQIPPLTGKRVDAILYRLH